MKKLILLFIALLFIGSAQANYYGVVARKNAGVSCSGTASFIWECDNVSVTVSGCSDGDTSATANDQATITTGWCVFDDSADNDGQDKYLFDMSGEDLADGLEMTVFIKFEVTTWVNDARLFSVWMDTTNLAKIQLTSSNDLLALHIGADDAYDEVALVGNNVSTGTTYIVRYRYKSDAGNDHELSLFSSTPGDYSSPTETDLDDDDLSDWDVVPGAADLNIGNRFSIASGSNFKIDYVHIYLEWRDDDPND